MPDEAAVPPPSTQPVATALIAGAILAATAWLLLAPDRVVSRLMTWDLLFNLEGAWRLLQGQVPHVDYHDPLGALAFWPTALGMHLLGPSVFASVFGKLLVAAVLYVAATVAASRRLMLLPAVLFVLFACDLVLIPTNTGSLADHFSFAMSYNTTGWAALSILALILFLPPAHADRHNLPDLAIAGLLLLALFHLKITYFLVGGGLLAAALVLAPHLRAHRMAWAGIGAAALANAAAPWNWPYLADIAAAIQTGAVHDSGQGALLLAAANATEIAIHAATLLVALALWRSHLAPLYLPTVVAVLLAAAVATFSQNNQLRGLPLACVAAFLVYHQLRATLARHGHGGLILLPLAALALPIAHVANATLSLAIYHLAARQDARHIVVDSTNLRGLAVPQPQSNAVVNQEVDYDWVANLRPIGGGVRVSQATYIQTILEAAALFHPSAGRPGGIHLLDQVNPMAFVLGRPAPRGVALWMDALFPFQPAATSFAEVNHVLVPKLSTYADLTQLALAQYGSYIAAHFPVRTETPHWILLSRNRMRP